MLRDAFKEGALCQIDPFSYQDIVYDVFQNFKREEQNFVVQNEINNMSFLITDTKSKMSKVSRHTGGKSLSYCM